MKRITFLVIGLLLLVANMAEARGGRGGYSYNYSQPTTYARPVTVAPAVQTVTPAVTTPATTATPTVTALKPVLPAVTPPVTATAAKPVVTAANSYSTATAQGVANIMASRGTVGHFGGNSGYEGCGMASTPQAAYSICCYANSGLTTVDVGYAQGSNGMWYCCRRYR